MTSEQCEAILVELREIKKLLEPHWVTIPDNAEKTVANQSRRRSNSKSV